MSEEIEIRNLRQSYYKYYRVNIQDPINDVRLYLDIVNGFMRFIMKKVFEGFFVQLGGEDSLGTIGIRGKKVKPFINEDGHVRGVSVSWFKTNKLWKEDPIAKANKTLVHCFNEHSHGIKYNFVWLKDDMRLHNKTMYSLTFSRKNKRTLPDLINSGKEYYVKPDKFRKIKN